MDALAAEVDDADRLAHALSFKTYGALLTGRPAAAAGMLHASRQNERVAVSLRAYDTYLQARSLAVAGDCPMCRRNVNSAYRSRRRQGPTYNTPALSFRDAGGRTWLRTTRAN